MLIGANARDEFLRELHIIDHLQEHGYSSDIITDLSLCDIPKGKRLWEYVVNSTTAMAGTVPIYLAVDHTGRIDESLLLDRIIEQCECGVSIITIHPTISQELIDLSKDRAIRCTSRGGAIVIRDLEISGKKDNVYSRILDRVIDACKAHDVIISIGSTFRSGCIADAMDTVFIKELGLQMELADYISQQGVNVVIETPGHIDPKKLFELCDMLMDCRFPIMPLGPMVTDIGFYEDDTVASIGAVLMGTRGCADILSVVTCREHMSGIPNEDDILRAMKKYKVAGHIIDLYKNGDKTMDNYVSRRRMINRSCNDCDSDCSRCGVYCPLHLVT